MDAVIAVEKEKAKKVEKSQIQYAKIKSYIMKVLIYGAAILTFGALIYIIVYIIINGISYIKPSLFAWTYTSDNASLTPALINTISMTLLSLAISIPFGIGSAIYLSEYAKRGSKFVKVVRMTTETLAGIPSIVYGLFGSIFFVTFLKMRLSLAAGACTLAIMILPLIMRTTEEALRSVPDLYREASFGLGAGKVRTIFKVILPAAAPGILSGIILAIGRIVGETAALLYTAGSVTKVAGLTDAARTLSTHMYLLSSESFHTGEAYGTAVVLLIVVIGINALASLAARKFGNQGSEK